MERKTEVAVQDCKIGYDQVLILVEEMEDLMEVNENKNVV